MGWIDPLDEPRLLADVQRRVKQLDNPDPRDKLVSQRLAEIYGRHPYIQTGTALALAEALADDGTVDKVAQESAKAQYRRNEQEQQQPNIKKSWWENALRNVSDFAFKKLGGGLVETSATIESAQDNPWVQDFMRGLGKIGGLFGGVLRHTPLNSDAVKTASKYAQGVGQFPWEYYNNYFSRLTDPNKPLSDTENIIASTTFGALLQNGDKSGSGFFLGGEAEQKRVEKVRKYRWQLANGQSFTIGRGTASLVFEPGSREYNYISGAIDAAGAFYTDALNMPLDEFSQLRAARKLIPAAETADEAYAAVVLAEHGGLHATSVQKTIDSSKFFDWLDNSRWGKRLVQRTAEETNELKILEAYNYKISPEQARRLAETTDPDKIRGIIAEQAIRLKETTTQGFVPFAESASELPITNITYDKIPGYRTFKNSRWLTKLPKEQILVNGTMEQKNGAIKNIANWMKTLGVDPYSGEGKELMTHAFDWATTQGSQADIYQVRKMLFGSKDKPGMFRMAMKSNGQPEAVIDEVLAQIEDKYSRLHANSINEAGQIDDRGFFLHLAAEQSDDELRKTLQELNDSGVLSDVVTDTTTRAEMDDILANIDFGQVSITSPASLAEVARNVIVLPDVREMKRLTNPFFKNNQYDRLAKVADAVDLFQNQIWRPYALMTFGFIMRNSFDAQLRMAMGGIGLRDPLNYIAMAMTTPKTIEKWGIRGRGWETITGQGWVDAAEDLGDVPQMMDDFVQAMNLKTTHLVDDPADRMTRFVRDGQVAVADVGMGESYTQGFVDTARQRNKDVLDRMAAQLADIPIDIQRQIVADFLDSGTEVANRARQEIISQMKNGLRAADQATGLNTTLQRLPNADKFSTQKLVELWYENNSVPRVQAFVMDQPDLRVLVGYNDTPAGALESWDEATATKYSVTGEKPKRGDLLVDDVTLDVDKPEFRYWRVLETQTSGANAPTRYRVMEVKNPGEAMNADIGSPQLRDYLLNKQRQHGQRVNQGLDPILPQKVKYIVRTPLQKGNAGARVYENVRSLPDAFFNGPVQSVSRMTERSPAFRSIYYKVASESAGGLTAAEAEKLFNDIAARTKATIPERYARNPEKAMSDYLGGEKNFTVFKENIDRAIATDSGIGTIDQLETYSLARARIDSQNLFFSNLERSNFADAMRIVAPFGAAWAEVAGTYARAMIDNPARMRKAQMIYRGGEQLDPENDGRGMFFKDPQSGQMMFAFPFYGMAMKALSTSPIELLGKLPGIPDISPSTPINAQFVAPVKQLNAGLSFIPSLGPVFQIATSKLFDVVDLPNEQGLRQMLNPYGTSNFDALLPGYFKKVVSGLFSNDTTTGSTFANSFADVFAHLASTGEYDLANSDDVARLIDDSKAGARGISILRGISQFFGPTAGRPEFRYTKKDKDNPALDQVFYVGEMVKTLSTLQAKNYETAVPEFLKMFGDNGYIYLAGKTKVDPAYGGLEVSKEFEEWRVKNRELVNAHKSVASYLAPVGDRDLSMPAWNAQLGEGLRKKLDGYDRLQLAQLRAGSGMYRAYRKSLPTILSDKDEKALQNYRKTLHEALPGFPIKPVFTVGDFEKQIDDFKKLIQDKRTKGNPVRDCLSNYLTYRDQQIAEVAKKSGKSLSSKKDLAAKEARGNLYAYGQKLAEAVPDFARAWNEILITETDMGTED